MPPQLDVPAIPLSWGLRPFSEPSSCVKGFVLSPLPAPPARTVWTSDPVHTLQRAIFFGRLPVQRGRRPAEAVAVSGALTLLTNIVIAWTTCRIQSVMVSRGAKDMQKVEHDWLRYVSPARSENVNFRGIYNFPVNLHADRVLEAQKQTRRSVL